MPYKSATRTWGSRFDPLPSSPPASPKPTVVATDNGSQRPASTDKKRERMPHDASVFVGSLPLHFDHNELGQLLSKHLAEYTQVKSVKVIRDTKGGVCAFVQCENAESANKLILALHSTAPKPFFGRQLRFEPARAFRSLLISYRTPTQTIPATNSASLSEKTVVQLTLPFAMRISKAKNAKSTDIFYGEEAIHWERFSNEHRHPSLFKQPLLCDVDTLEEICTFFGPLEYFRSYKPEGDDESDNKNPTLFPSPHDAPRNSNMDKGCFEVKWAYRDDCLSALMTLRRVPHFTVTWAHAAPDREFHFRQCNPQPYPLLTQVQINSDSVSTTGRFPKARTDEWMVRPDPPSLLHDGTSLSQTSTCVDSGSNQGMAWLETDFPPLIDGSNKSGFEFGDWVEKKPPVQVEKGKDEGRFVDGPSFESDPFTSQTPRAAFGEKLDDVTSLSKDHRSTATVTAIPDSGQEIELHHTPALARSPVTPKTPLFPPTPTSYHGERPGLFSKEADEFSYKTEETSVDGQAIDPTSLFVGGLEMHGPSAWDERKVYTFFRRFGGLESVKMIRPSTGKAAFAFVKFDNTESPATAITELHNRVIDGRAIRVQLRDCNPPRSPYRGRRRYSYLNQGHQYRQSEKEDKSVDASLGRALTISEDPAESHAGFNPSDESVSENPSVDSDVELVTESSLLNAEPSVKPALPQETYREWYEMDNRPPVSASTPPTSGPFTSEGGSGLIYPPMPLYGPAHWMQQYAPPHMHYPVTYYPPIYPVPPQQPPRYPGSGSDAGGPNTLPPVPWTSVNYGYIPYQGYPSRVADQEQAPVVPTGFFQNETGTLIPVYPRAIIDQYMTNSSSQSSSPPIGVPVTVTAAVSSTAPSPIPGGPGQAWPQGIPPTFGPTQLPPRAGHFPNQIQGQPGHSPAGWIAPAQSMGFLGHLAQGLSPSGGPFIGASPGGFHGGLGPNNGRKRQGRRELSTRVVETEDEARIISTETVLIVKHISTLNSMGV